MAVEPIKIEGLRDLQASLKKMDGQSQKQLRLVFNSVAEKVVTGAQGKIPVRTGRARASIKAASSQREARVKGGGGRAPYLPWLEFGGAVGRRRSVRRPFIADGRYIYGTYRDRRPSIEDEIRQGLIKLVRDSGLEVS